MKQMYYWLMLLVLVPFSLIAQNGSVKGRVTDATTSAPLPGVSVTVNTPTGNKPATTTNESGDYSLAIPATATTIVFTYTGMESKTEVIKGRSIINIQLASTSQELQQVVVVGY